MKFQKIALGFLLCTSAVAFAQYKPSYTVVKSFTRIEVNKDASFTQFLEEQDRVDTPQGIRMLGERKITYNSTLEDVEVLEAYTIQPDGTRINVPLATANPRSSSTPNWKWVARCITVPNLCNTHPSFQGTFLHGSTTARMCAMKTSWWNWCTMPRYTWG
jgi:hypothetical protein